MLVLGYLKRTGRANPEIQMKAEEYINLGYQRLLTFECPSGGFDWTGQEPGKLLLTAYGLQEFADMAKVYPAVDEKLIQRTQKWVLGKQGSDGTWDPEQGTVSYNWPSLVANKMVATSYITWSLLESGYKGPELSKALAYVRAHVGEIDQPYFLGIAANCLVAADPNDATTLQVLDRLNDMRKEEGSACWWDSNQMSITYSKGNNASLETTALIAYAFIKGKAHSPTVIKALTYLIQRKDAYGTWESTQATILALKALIEGTGRSLGDDKGGQVQIAVNGQNAAEITITPETSDVLQQVDVTPFGHTGDNTVSLKVAGDIEALYQIITSYWIPTKLLPAPKPEIMDIEVNYDKKKLTTDDLLECQAHIKYKGKLPTAMVIVDLGIPPGFDVTTYELDGLKAEKTIERYEVTGRQVIIYLQELKPNTEKYIAYHLKARFPIKAKTPRSQVYEYYTPTNRATAEPVELEVTQG